MKNTFKIITIIVVLLALVQSAFTQKEFHFEPFTTVNINDSVVIRLNDYQGDIQWQKSSDLETWENIAQATVDTLLFVANTSTYFRAEVIVRECDPFYSDTTKVGVFDLTTSAVTEITTISALSGGTVISDGGAPITARGVVWSTSPYPTIDNNDGYTVDGQDLGEFISNITDLAPETSYYVRSYATNIAGTGYGESKLFTTLNDIPESYTLTLQVAPEGTGLVSGSGEFAEGAAVTITATSNQNYQFVNWTGDTEHIADANAAITTLTMPAQNITLAANFEEENEGCDDTEIVEALNPATGKIWMDRNLGACRAATSSTDSEAFGHLYQWGRAADGHQRRTSDTTSTLSNSNTPGHNKFIVTGLIPPNDWRTPQNHNLWQGVLGINNPCPSGYRLPTDAELNAERQSWSSNDAAGAFNSPIKLPMAGLRSLNNGKISSAGSLGIYWSSTVSGSDSGRLDFNSNTAGVSSRPRASGLSVRCLKAENQQPDTYTLSLEITPEGSGQVSGEGDYAEGLTVFISAIPNLNYRFVNWTGDTGHIADANASSTNLTMPAENINLTANFEEDENGNPNIIYGEGVTDIDGNFYPSVIIGNQEWMARNLNVTHDANGNAISRYCYDNNETYCDLYGGLYTWQSVMNGEGSSNTIPSNVQGICPTGWHLPSNSEWNVLVNNVVEQGYPNASDNPNGAGSALKSCRQVLSPLGGDCATSEHPYWIWANNFGTDEFGFSALPGGYRYPNGAYYSLGYEGNWWSSSIDFSNWVWFRKIYNIYGNVDQSSYTDDYGFSVRCVRD